MTPNDYQQAALRTAPGDLPPERLLLNGLMGLNGEAGEAIDILKKHLFQGHELDTAHMAKELGASTVTEADTDAFSLTQDMAIKSGRKSNPSSFLRISNTCL